MKIELVETINTFRIKIPRLNDTQYLQLCKILESTNLDEDTRMGEEANYIVVHTTEGSLYVEDILKQALEAVKKPILQMNPLIKYGSIKEGQRFLIEGKATVYTKKAEVLYNKVVSKGFEGGSLSMIDDCLVYPINTELNFVTHNLLLD